MYKIVGMLLLGLTFANAQAQTCGVILSKPFYSFFQEARGGQITDKNISTDEAGITLPEGWSGYISVRTKNGKPEITLDIGHSGDTQKSFKLVSQIVTEDRDLSLRVFDETGRITVDRVLVRGQRILDGLKPKGIRPYIEIGVTTSHILPDGKDIETVTHLTADLTRLRADDAIDLINRITRLLLTPVLP